MALGGEVAAYRGRSAERVSRSLQRSSQLLSEYQSSRYEITEYVALRYASVS